MKRDYDNGVKDDVVYFTGFEVEKTPVHGKLTLFVVGNRPLQEVLAKAEQEQVEHIYLGANQSFGLNPIDQNDEWIAWDNLTKGLLEKDYWVTLDYDARYHEGVLEMPALEYSKFIPMISVKLPYIQQLPYHTHIKLDDKDFKATNPGVWVHRLHDLKTSTTFTDWDRYKDDTPSMEN